MGVGGDNSKRRSSRYRCVRDITHEVRRLKASLLLDVFRHVVG